MGTIKCGFRTFRFLISPEEFNDWTELCILEGFRFYLNSGDMREVPVDEVRKKYLKFYKARMSVEHEAESIPLVCYSIKREDFNSEIHIITKDYSFFPPNRPPFPLARTALYAELSAPRQCPVASDDGTHFTYEDISQIEPNAQAVFERLSVSVKKFTKPLYYNDRTAYSIRISRNAWHDLSQSALIRGTGVGLSCNWK